MKSDVVQFVFALVVLIVGGACEEFLPKVFGVGFPVLLTATVFLAPRRSTTAAVLFALAAGGFEDALCALPFATSVSFFTLVALISRTERLSYGMLAVVYPVYQIWLWLWHASGENGIFGRLLVSAPIGVFAAVVVSAVLFLMERRSAIDE